MCKNGGNTDYFISYQILLFNVLMELIKTCILKIWLKTDSEELWLKQSLLKSDLHNMNLI